MIVGHAVKSLAPQSAKHLFTYLVGSPGARHSASMAFAGPGRRTYEDAVQIIESRQRRKRPKGTSSATSTQSTGNMGTPDLRGFPGITGMREWLDMLGHSPDAINSLNVIHLAGTKGKGSTCAFTESFLRARGTRTGFPRKTGMYTSPHLLRPEERIRINASPLATTKFAQYLFEVYDKLPQLALEYDPGKSVVDRGPRSLQLYALLALHVFIRERVDVAIIETHSGGEYDATNVVTRPVVTAITSLGMDHVQTLGPSIENIAWHKGGIYKAGAAALSTKQDPEPARVLVERAGRVGEDLTFVEEDPNLPRGTLQLKPLVQRKNASLAVAAANAFLSRTRGHQSESLDENDVRLGVEQWHWPGRFEILCRGQCTYFVDAAHNDMSVGIAADWFVESSREMSESAVRVLVFSHINELRDAVGVLRSLGEALQRADAHMEHVVITTYAEDESDDAQAAASDLAVFRDTWAQRFPDSRIWLEPTVGGAMMRVEEVAQQHVGKDVHVLVTGSQHLVGPALRLLNADQQSPGLRQPSSI